MNDYDMGHVIDEMGDSNSMHYDGYRDMGTSDEFIYCDTYYHTKCSYRSIKNSATKANLIEFDDITLWIPKSICIHWSLKYQTVYIHSNILSEIRDTYFKNVETMNRKYSDPEMTYSDAKEFILDKLLVLFHDRLKEVYPDMYDVCHVTGEEHDKCNHSMYSYYGRASESLLRVPITPKYGKFRDNPNEYNFVIDMYDDLKNAECPVVWMVESIPILG